MQAIYQAVERHTILLFVVDDIHFLRVRSKSGQETSNFLKSLMSLTGATFIYVGVDVEQMGVLRSTMRPRWPRARRPRASSTSRSGRSRKAVRPGSGCCGR